MNGQTEFQLFAWLDPKSSSNVLSDEYFRNFLLKNINSFSIQHWRIFLDWLDLSNDNLAEMQKHKDFFYDLYIPVRKLRHRIDKFTDIQKGKIFFLNIFCFSKDRLETIN